MVQVLKGRGFTEVEPYRYPGVPNWATKTCRKSFCGKLIRKIPVSSRLNCTVSPDIPFFSLLVPCSLCCLRPKQHVTPCSSVACGEIPWIPCSFPASRADFAHFGHNLRFLGLTTEKFPAKFPAPGNLGSSCICTILHNFVKTITVSQPSQESFSTAFFSSLFKTRRL